MTGLDRFYCTILVHLVIHVALAVGQPFSKVPYSTITIRNITGLPKDWMLLKHPSMMSNQELEELYSRRDAIKFIGMFYALSIIIIMLV